MRVTVDVDVDVDDILEQLDDAELASYGLMRVKDSSIPEHAVHSPWHDVQQAMRQRDANRLENLLTTLAWDQAGVILPVGLPVIH